MKAGRKNVFRTREEEKQGKQCFPCDQRHKFWLTEFKYKCHFCGSVTYNIYGRENRKGDKGVRTGQEEEEEQNQRRGIKEKENQHRG